MSLWLKAVSEKVVRKIHSCPKKEEVLEKLSSRSASVLAHPRMLLQKLLPTNIGFICAAQNYNALSYDDKILDGCYDLYGILAESNSEKMPSLVDLQGTPVTDTTSWEAALVYRATDANLIKLEQKALVMTAESRSETLSFIDKRLVKKLVALDADYMGGPVVNPESMLKAWRGLSNTLRATQNNMVLPFGCLTIGLARHRALLFNVLADSVGVPCRLMKGRQYTGSDDVAMSIVKFDGRR